MQYPQNYSQSNKKGEMAAKMVTKYKMNGKTTGAGGGMKPRGTGKNSGKGGGMAYPETGKGTGKSGGMGYEQSNEKKSFSRNYTQNGEC